MSSSPLFDAPHGLGDSGEQADSRLHNHDLAPVPHTRRTWTGYSIFAMWMSDVLCVGVF